MNQCNCTCHKDGIKFIKTSLPAQPCCPCESLKLKNPSYCIRCLKYIEECDCMWDSIRKLVEHKNIQIEENCKLSKRLDELHKEIHAGIDQCMNAINLEDRITASDVLCRITVLENLIPSHYPYKCPLCKV